MTAPVPPAACDFHIDLETGLARGTVYLPSPHCNARPAGVPIDLVVIHAISLPAGEYGGDDVAALFLGRLDCTRRADYGELANLRVSAHFLIRRDGQVQQFVPVHRRAWHAGMSRFAGREHCNDFSVGIELEGSEHDRFTADQYAALAALTRALRTACPAIRAENIVGHSQIAPGRKTDPGPYFDWAGYRAALMEA